MTAARCLSFAAAVRVIDRVHSHAAIVRTAPEPAAAAGFAERNVLMLYVADLSDCGHAFNLDTAYLARRQLQQCDAGFLGH